VRDIAMAEVSTSPKEFPVGSNRTKYGQWYGWDGVYWCDIFLQYVFAKAGGADLLYTKTASVWVTYQQFLSRGRFGSAPRVGALAVFRNWQHIELVIDTDPLTTVGGNTSWGAGSGSLSNGWYVAKNVREPSLIMGYCYPEYDVVRTLFEPMTVDGLMDLTARYSYDVRCLQIYLNHELDGADLLVDGAYGPKTVAALQRWIRHYPDGTWSPVNTRALQAKIGAVVDGVWGPATTKRLQGYLNDHRTYTTH
jgi:hypothetical protein